MNYRYSYSGADAISYAWFPVFGEAVVKIESLHTVSFSVHEGKGQVRTLGYRGIRGLTRGVRTIAGSMIFTIIENHPLAALSRIATERNMPVAGWSRDAYLNGMGHAFSENNLTNRLAVTLPPFDLLVTYMHENITALDRQELIKKTIAWGAAANAGEAPPTNEVLSGDGAAMLLKGVEFIDEGIVTSVNDIVSEMTVSFIARDLKTIDLLDNAFKVDATKAASEFGAQMRRDREAEIKQAQLAQILGVAKHNQSSYDSITNRGSRVTDMAPAIFDENGDRLSSAELPPHIIPYVTGAY